MIAWDKKVIVYLYVHKYQWTSSMDNSIQRRSKLHNSVDTVPEVFRVTIPKDNVENAM